MRSNLPAFEVVGTVADQAINLVLKLGASLTFVSLLIAAWYVFRHFHEVAEERRSQARDRTAEINDRAEQRAWDRDNAKRIIRDAYSEYHRHTKRNWKVLDQIEKQMPSRGIPNPVTFQKMRFIDNRNLFANPFAFSLNDAERAAILNLEPLIR